MKFDRIDRLILFGGALCLAEFAARVQALARHDVRVFTCDRQLDEVLDASGRTLRNALDELKVAYRSTSDINRDEQLRDLITPATLGLGFGEAWSFGRDLLGRFNGRLLDLMGVRLPTYRGGAHYTWQILRNNRVGCCCLQVINEHMVQGEFDSGEIVKSKEYLLPASARTPADYFAAAVANEVEFLLEFLAEAGAGRDFPLARLQEDFSQYYPRLNTLRHGFIDWSWGTLDLERFICAFDDPYAGASTFLNGRRVHLKQCRSEFLDGAFHPFQAGLIYRLAHAAAFVCTRDGSLIVQRVVDERGKDMLSELKPGMRFATPRSCLDEALAYSAVYTPTGLAT
jgi:hypothetical protein